MANVPYSHTIGSLPTYNNFNSSDSGKLKIRDYRLTPAKLCYDSFPTTENNIIPKSMSIKAHLVQSKVHSRRGYCSLLGGASDTSAILPQISTDTFPKQSKSSKTIKSSATASFQGIKKSQSLPNLQKSPPLTKIEKPRQVKDYTGVLF